MVVWGTFHTYYLEKSEGMESGPSKLYVKAPLMQSERPRVLGSLQEALGLKGEASLIADGLVA